MFALLHFLALDLTQGRELQLMVLLSLDTFVDSFQATCTGMVQGRFPNRLQK